MENTTQSGRAWLVPEAQLREWLKSLAKSENEILAPVELEPGYLAFRSVTETDKIVLDGKRTISSPKSYYHPASEEILIPPEDSKARRRVIFGIHACDLNGMKILAGALLGTYSDPQFRERIEGIRVVAVTCLEPSENCFCTSMGTGPSISDGFDLLVTRLGDQYLIEQGTDAGQELLKGMKLVEASPESFESKSALLDRVRLNMPKQFKTLGIPELLTSNYNSEVWSDFADRCLGCANCTMVCPTCYCYDIKDWSDAKLKRYGRSRIWDSCQSFAFASVHGGNFRPDQTARLRQFVCHKLAFWVEQYGRFGCVGCGRCMTWCPTGIDLTEIADAIRKQQV